MNEWKECSLGDVLTLQRGHDLPKTKMIAGNVPVAGSNGAIGYHNKATTKAPGVTIGRSGNVGNAYLYREDFWAHNTTLYVKDFKGNDEIFVYYFLKNINFAQFNAGSAVPTLNRNHIHPLAVRIPPRLEQKAITAVLASLDDKIDLLHRQNKTLEALAQTLFHHWFIDGAGDDWEDGCLGDISENIRDGIKHDQVPNGTIYIGLEHIDKKSIALNRHGLSDDVNSNKYKFVEEDVLFGKLRPYFHKVCFTPFSGICSTDILVLRPKKPDYFCFSLFAFYQKDVIDYANLGSGGTRMPRTNWNTLKEYPIAFPPEKLINQFNDMIYPSIKKIRTNLSQIRTLEKLRDTLLPKLMSGAVRVRH